MGLNKSHFLCGLKMTQQERKENKSFTFINKFNVILKAIQIFRKSSLSDYFHIFKDMKVLRDWFYKNIFCS